MATLYELTSNAAALYEMLQAEEIDEQTFNDTLEAMGAGDKVETYCKLIKQLQGDCDIYAAEISRLEARKATAKKGIERMRGALLDFLRQSGQDRVKTALFTVSTAATPKVNITDERMIPRAYLVEQPPIIDKNGIKRALKDGATITGAELIYNTGVRIR